MKIKSLAQLCMAAIAAMSGLAPQAHGQNWIGPNGNANEPGGGNWNVTTHWSPAGVPASASTTVLTFNSGTVNYDANNNLGAFTVNRINHGTGDGTGQVRITGDALNFSGANAGIYSTGSGQFFMRTAINSPGTLIASSNLSNANFRLNDQNVDNSISVNELRVMGNNATVGGEIVIIRGTQNNIGSIVLDGGTLANPSAAFNTPAVVFFGQGGQLATGVPNSANKADMNTGGWHSLAPGYGDISARSTNVGGYWFTSNVAAGDEYTFSGTFGATGGTGAARTRLRKQGPGTQIITGNYGQGGDSSVQMRIENGLLWFTDTSSIGGTGNRTEIAGGTLRIDGLMNNGAGEVQVLPNGTLAGFGEIRRNVVVDGTLSPGGSAGTLTIGQIGNPRTLTLNSDSSYDWEWENGTSQLINVIGDVVFDGAFTVNLIDLGGTPPDYFTEYDIFTATGDISGIDLDQWTLEIGTTGWVDALVGSDDNRVFLTNLGFAPTDFVVPEPASIALWSILALILAAYAARRRAKT